MARPTSTTSTRRGFFSALIAVAALAVVPEAEARGRSGGSRSHSHSGGGRSGRSSGGYGGGGSRGGCGSRGGAGYRKANGKCAGRNE
jgi:hypothetical protein